MPIEIKKIRKISDTHDSFTNRVVKRISHKAYSVRELSKEAKITDQQVQGVLMRLKRFPHQHGTVANMRVGKNMYYWIERKR